MEELIKEINKHADMLEMLFKSKVIPAKKAIDPLLSIQEIKEATYNLEVKLADLKQYMKGYHERTNSKNARNKAKA
jgi:hypothetical protein